MSLTPSAVVRPSETLLPYIHWTELYFSCEYCIQKQGAFSTYARHKRVPSRRRCWHGSRDYHYRRYVSVIISPFSEWWYQPYRTVILMHRIYAMYEASRFMLFLCLVFLLVEGTAFGIFFGVHRRGIICMFPSLLYTPHCSLNDSILRIVTNSPSRGVFLCTDSDPHNGTHWMAYEWTVMLLMELILVSLAVYKGWSHRGKYGGSLMKSLTRDSVLYFVV